MFGCDEAIRIYEKSQLLHIIGNNQQLRYFFIFCTFYLFANLFYQQGVIRGDVGMRYLAKFWPNSTRVVDRDEMIEMWPEELMRYLESVIVFSPPPPTQNGGATDSIAHGMDIDTVAIPQRIEGLLFDWYFSFLPNHIFIFFSLSSFSACSNFGSKMRYLFDYGDRHLVFCADHIRTRYANFIVEYLERSVTRWVDIPRTLSTRTRSMRKAIAENGAQKVGIDIVRNYQLESFLIKGPSRAPVVLRQTFTNVPIGARGRKRSTKSFLFIGMKPNPDNRPIVQPAKRTHGRLASTPIGNSVAPINHRRMSTPFQPRQPVQAIDSLPNPDNRPIVQPAKRTYGRLASTPIGNTVAPINPRRMSTPFQPIPENNLLPSEQGPSVSSSERFDDNFGVLRYSSDSD